jgi:hypothetical protein
MIAVLVLSFSLYTKFFVVSFLYIRNLSSSCRSCDDDKTIFSLHLNLRRIPQNGINLVSAVSVSFCLPHLNENILHEMIKKKRKRAMMMMMMMMNKRPRF